MDDLRRPRIALSSWVPIRSQQILRKDGEYWKLGCIEEYFGAVSIILPAEAHAQAMQIQWIDAGRHQDGPWVQDGRYFQAGTFQDDQSGGLTGSYPILIQHRDADHQTEWYLDQDLLLALGLKRENDTWVCPAEDFLDIVRLQRDAAGRPEYVGIRAEQLRDYLCARNAGLLVATYRYRRAVFANRPNFTWDSCDLKQDIEGGRWQAFLRDID